MKYIKLWENFISDIGDIDNEKEQGEDNPQQFDYMMLGRLQQDCEYFLGNGRGHEKHLHYGNIVEHIEEMKKLWDKLNIKPEWLSYEDILDYEEKMLNY